MPVKSPKTLPSPSPNGLEDLLREILVFKSRRGGTGKKQIGCLCVMCVVNKPLHKWYNSKVPSPRCVVQNAPNLIIWLDLGRILGHFGGGCVADVWKSPGTVSHATCWVNGWVEGGHWNKAGREQRVVAVGSGSRGRVGVTKHGICTLQFQRKGQAHCMWGYACICIRRILRMWDPALVCNPMRDLSPANNPVSMVGVRVCIADVMFDWLITAPWEKCRGSAWNYSKWVGFFFAPVLY